MRYSADYVFPVSGEPLRNGYVDMTDDGIVTGLGLLEDNDNDAIRLKGFLVPGFVNSHCHLELSHLKGMFKQATGMDGFIRQINDMRLNVDCQGRMRAMTDEMDSLYRQGVSAMADVSNCDESFDLKAGSPLYTRTFLEVFGTEPVDALQIIANVLTLQKIARDKGIDAAPSPHSCYTMSPLLNRMAASEGLKSGYISYHSQESNEEEEMIKYGSGPLADDYHERKVCTPPVTGTSALIYFIENLKLACEFPVEGNILLVHNVTTDQESIDAAMAAFKNVFWVLCPLSNLFIHRVLPDVGLLRKNKLNLCLGTDSLSSNTVLSMVEEMKCIQDNFPEVGFDEMLRWTTLNGADAIGKGHIYGSFENGKRPGLVNIEDVDINNVKLTCSSLSNRII